MLDYLMSIIWLPVFFLFFYYEQELGAGIDPGIWLISIWYFGWDEIQTNNRELSKLTTRPEWRPIIWATLGGPIIT